MNVIRTQIVDEMLRVEMHVEGHPALYVRYDLEQLGGLISMFVDQERDLLGRILAKTKVEIPPFLLGQ